MKTWLSLLLLLLIHSGLKAQLSGTYTINPNKKDSGNNYISVYEASQDLISGYRTYFGVKENGPGVSGPVIFEIADGKYNDVAIFSKIKGSSTKNTITFESASHDSSKLTLILGRNSSTPLTFDGVKNLIFKNITVKTEDYSSQSSIILVKNGAKNISFTGCRFLGYPNSRVTNIITCYDADTNININNNYFTYYNSAIQGKTTYSGNPGLYSPVISNNTFDSGTTSINLASIYNPAIQNNTITGSVNTGIQLAGITGGMSLKKNNINANNGIIILGLIADTGTANIENNMIISTVAALSISNTKNLRVFYNSCSIYPTLYTSQFAQAITLINDTITLKNNIFANFANESALGLYGSAKEIISDNNDFYVPDSAICSFGTSFTSATKEKDLTKWHSATSLDAHSVSYNPLFQSVTNNHAFSPNLQKGTPLSTIKTDIDNKTRAKNTTTIGANEITVYQTDAGINTIDSLRPSYCRGESGNAYVRLANYGTDSLKSTTINWSVNGIIQTPVSWTGKLGPGKTTEVKSGVIHFNRTGIVKCWTVNYNSYADSNHINDTAITYVRVKMNNNYTIGGYGSDFKNFNDAKKELLRSTICGPVLITVKDSTYREQLNLPAIYGMNATNTITFESQSGDSSRAVMAFPSSNDNTVLNYTLRIDSGKHYIFKNLGFVRTGIDTEAAVLVLTTLSDSNTFSGNMFVSNKVFPRNSYSVSTNLVVDLQGTNRINFTRNLVRNGSTGIFIGDSLIYYFGRNGVTPFPYQKHDDSIAGNIIDSSYYFGITGSVVHLLFSNNTVSNILCAKPIAVNLSGDSFNVENNRIFLTRGGLGIVPATNTICHVINNFIGIISNKFYPSAQGISFDPGVYTDSTVPCSIKYYLENNSINITGNDSLSTNLYINDHTSYLKSFINIFVYNNNLVNTAAGKTISFFKTNRINCDNNNLITNGQNIGTVYDNKNLEFLYYKTLSDWTKANGIDSNSIGITPWFRSDADLHARNPVLAKKGKTLSDVLTDIDGIKRNTKPTIGANELNPVKNDAGVNALIWPPLNFCAGTNDYKISLRNFGTDTLYSDSIIWNLLNITQAPYAFSGKIAPGDSTVVDIGNGTLTYSTDSDFFVSKNPNGNMDSNRTNDSARYHFNSSMSGTYTIGGTSPDFTTIGQAVSTLIRSHVCNPVIFKIRDGIYKERVSIPSIIGVSVINTVTFESESGDSSKVLITYPSSSSYKDPNYIIRLDSVSYYRFRNLSFIRTGKDSNATIFRLWKLAAHNEFTSCRFISVKSAVSTSVKSALFVDLFNGSNVFKNCLFKNGSYATTKITSDSISYNIDNYSLGQDTIYHCTADSCITGFTDFSYVANSNITNFVYDAISTGTSIGNRFYSSRNISEVLNSCYGVVNNIISTSAPIGLLNCSNIYYNNIALFGNNQYCTEYPAPIVNSRNDVGNYSHVKNNNILLYTDQFLVYYFGFNIAGLDSTTFNYNNAYSYANLFWDHIMDVGYYIPYSGGWQEFNNDNNGLSTWGSRYNTNYNSRGYPDKNSVDIDVMPLSIQNPETQNYLLAHAGKPVAGITTDIYGNKRDTMAPSIGAVEVKNFNHNIGILSLNNNQVCGDTAFNISVVIQNRTSAKESKIPIFAQISQNGNLQLISDTIQGPVKGLSTDTFTFKKHLNLYKTNIYRLKVWIASSNDQNRMDDTLSVPVSIIGNPVPRLKDSTVCGSGPVRLILDSLKPGNTVSWFKNKNDTKPIYTGDTLISGNISGDSIFYVSEQNPQPFYFGADDTAGYVSRYSGNSGSISLSVFKDCSLDSATIYPQHSGSFRVIVHSGTDRYYRYSVHVSYPYQPVRVALKIPLYQSTGSLSVSIDSITTGNLKYAHTFGNIYPMTIPGILTISDFGIADVTYSDCESAAFSYFYNCLVSSSCAAIKFPVKVYMTGKSSFSLDKNAGFRGKYNSGTLSDPDEVCTGNSLIYNLFTSFPDANYGSSWKIKSLSFNSTAGLSSKDTVLIKPSKKGIGRFVFTPSGYNTNDSIFKLTITIGSVSGSGCDSTLTRYIRVSGVDKAKFSVLSGSCTGNLLYFHDSVSYNPGNNYYWDFGDNSFSTDSLPSHTFTTAGNYKVVLSVLNTSGCPDTFSKYIHVLNYPHSKISSGTTVCSGYAMQFDDKSGLQPGTIRKWDFGDGTNDTAETVNHTYKKPGTYLVKLNLSNLNNCKDSASENITVKQSPVAKIFTADSVACIGATIYFTDTSTDTLGPKRDWDFNNGMVNFARSTYIAYYKPGTYTVVLGETNQNGCVDTARANIIINPLPIPDFSYSKTLCAADSIKFTDISSPKTISRTWDFGDNSTNNPAAATVKHKYASPGSFYVSIYVVSDKGCRAYSNKQIVVNANPKAMTSNDSGTCISSLIKVRDKSVIANETRTWSYGDGATDTARIALHQYAKSGKYFAKLTVKDNNGCRDSDSTKVTIYPLPWPSFSIKDTAQCLSNSFVCSDSSFISSGTITKWNWNFGDNTHSNRQNPPGHTYNSEGTYNIKLILSSNYGCLDSIDKSILIYPQPRASFNLKDTAECLTGNGFAFTNTSTISSGRIVSWTWKYGDGTQSALQKPGNHSYAKEGAYATQLKVISLDGCTDSSSAHIYVNAEPKIAFGVNDSIQCLNGNDFKFTDHSSVSSGALTQWNWDFGNTKTASTQNTDIVYKNAGTYPVKLTITSDQGCMASGTDTMRVNANPVANAGVNSTICAGDVDSIGGPASAGISYSWASVPPGFTSTLSNPQVLPAHSTTYVLTETISITGCRATDSVFVRAKPHPSASYRDTLIGNHYIFEALDSSFSSSDYHWDFGDGSSGVSGYHASHLFPKNKVYDVTLYVSDTDGCSMETGSNINVTISGIAEFITEGLHIKVYPNPFEDNTIIECNSSAYTSLRINLYDLNGKLIGNIADKTVQAGIYQWNINAENYQLKKGVYILKVITPNGETNYRIVKM